MKAIVTGIERNSGIRKADGEPFDSCQIYIAAPLQAVSSANFQRKSYGYESKPLRLNTEAFSQFAPYIDKLPIELDLETGSYFNRENVAVTTVTGVISD